MIQACITCDRPNGDADGHRYSTEAVMHIRDVMAMVMEVTDIVIESKL